MIQLSEHAVFSALRTLFCDAKGQDTVISSLSSVKETDSSDAIRNLEEEASFIEALSAVFSQVIQKHIATLRRRRNQLLPFYRLPPEILVQIITPLVNLNSGDEYLTSFSQQSDVAEVGEHHSTITSLSRVSSYWRNTIVSCPQLWTRIDATHNTRCVEVMLQRSKNVPLDIMIGVIREKDQNMKVDFNTFLAHCSRWRSFYHEKGTLEIDEEESPWMKEGAMPMLESFHVTSYLDRLPDAVRAQASKLVHLGINLVKVPLDLGPLPSLRTISMGSDGNDGPLTASQWYNFLSSAPRLRNIRIIHRYFLRGHTLDRFKCGIYLPELQEISFSGPLLSLFGTLLGAIISADNKCPFVRFSLQEKDVRGSIYDYPAFAGSILSKLQEIEVVKASKAGRSNLISCSWRGNDDILKLDTHRSEYMESSNLWARLLMPSTGFISLRSLEICSHEFFDGPNLLQKICLCSALERLVVRSKGNMGQVAFVSDLCMLLATLQLSQLSNQLSWPCAGLRYLELDYGFLDLHLSSLLHCIEARYGVQSTVVPNPLPVFLQELRLTDWEDMEVDWQDRAVREDAARLKEVLHNHGTLLSSE
ncbi:hypothetical protein FRC03_009255 [Tulasnella sp. 419]|nr:hypothetical protein FRC03_009255 [Tulasnella sp. 419]